VCQTLKTRPKTVFALWWRNVTRVAVFERTYERRMRIKTLKGEPQERNRDETSLDSSVRKKASRECETLRANVPETMGRSGQVASPCSKTLKGTKPRKVALAYHETAHFALALGARATSVGNTLKGS
jgi:hypothetical protein